MRDDVHHIGACVLRDANQKLGDLGLAVLDTLLVGWIRLRVCAVRT